MTRQSRFKSRIILVIAYLGCLTLLWTHYQNLRQQELALRTHLIRIRPPDWTTFSRFRHPADKHGKTTSGSLACIRRRQSWVRAVSRPSDLPVLSLANGPWQCLEVVLSNNQKLTYVPGEHPVMSLAPLNSWAWPRHNPGIIGRPNADRPDNLLLQLPMQEQNETRGLVNAEIP